MQDETRHTAVERLTLLGLLSSVHQTDRAESEEFAAEASYFYTVSFPLEGSVENHWTPARAVGRVRRSVA